MKLTVFWTWYVWLVTWTCLAEVWHDVMCIDIDETKIENLKKWIIPIYEPWLDHLVERNFKEWRLTFSTDAVEWVNFWDVIFSAVWTPPDENHKADLRFVKKVAQTVWEKLDTYKVFVNKSTVPVWTWKLCKQIIQDELDKRWIDLEFDVVSNPEFLREWTAVRDFLAPNRIVVWWESKKAKEIMYDVYKPFIRNDRPLFFTDIKSSEIIKYASNAFLATKISFINEIANFAEIVGANVWDISRWMWLDERIWSKFLHAWIWYGWSCFPKDVQALIETWKENWYEFRIIQATEDVNKSQKTRVVSKLEKHIWSLEWKCIAIWWLAFKPKTDDIREAPSLEVIDRLLRSNISQIKAFDPVAADHVKSAFQSENKITFTSNYYDALKWADALLILTEWDEFRMPDFKRIKDNMNWNIVIDWRNIWNKDSMNELWFVYEWIWKP